MNERHEGLVPTPPVMPTPGWLQYRDSVGHYLLKLKITRPYMQQKEVATLIAMMAVIYSGGAIGVAIVRSVQVQSTWLLLLGAILLVWAVVAVRIARVTYALFRCGQCRTKHSLPAAWWLIVIAISGAGLWLKSVSFLGDGSSVSVWIACLSALFGGVLAFGNRLRLRYGEAWQAVRVQPFP